MVTNNMVKYDYKIKRFQKIKKKFLIEECIDTNH